MTYKFPELPENQRWRVHIEFNTFVIVRLQEKRRWWWTTIADSVELVHAGDVGLSRCVDHILRRDYYARIRAEADAKKESNRQAVLQSIRSNYES